MVWADQLSWIKHAENILKRCTLAVGQCKVTEHKDCSLALEFYDSEWTMQSGTFLKQMDGFNCGPIACLKLMELFSPSLFDKATQNMFHPTVYRPWVMNQFKVMLRKFKKDLQISIPKSNDIKDFSTPNDTSIQCECFCYDDNEELEVTDLSCCKKRLHVSCFLEFLQTFTSCPYCRSEVTQIIINGCIIPYGAGARYGIHENNITLSQEASTVLPTNLTKASGCTCKEGMCTKKCGCWSRMKKACNLNCSCNGQCNNPHNI